MKTKNLLRVALPVCTVLGLSQFVAADLIIDDFNTVATGEIEQRVVAPRVDSNGDVVQFDKDEIALGAGNIGETRYLSVDRTVDPDNPNADAVSFAVNRVTGRGVYQTGTQGKGDFVVAYDGNVDQIFAPDDANGLNLDFTSEGGLAIFAESDSGIQLALKLFSNGSVFTSLVTVAANDINGVPGLQRYFRAFTTFSGTGTLDLSDVDAISIINPVADPDAGQDVSLDLLKTSAIPEPSSMILLTLTGLGCAGNAIRRRRKALAASGKDL